MSITIQPVSTTAPPQTVAPNKFNNALTTISNALTNVVKPAADIYSQVKTGSQPGSPSSSTPAYSPDVVSPAVVPAPLANTKKYLMIGGVVVLAGTAVYFLTRKKKKGVSGVGDLDTSKTKSGRVKQRKAVFAKMDESGNTWPKNKKGLRKKKRK